MADNKEFQKNTNITFYIAQFRSKEKLLVLIVKLDMAIIPDDSHLFEYKNRIGDIENIQHKPKPVDLNNISFIVYKCNEKLIISLQTFSYNLPHHSFHYK